MKIPLSQIRPSTQQIRKEWDDKSIDELAQSIQEQGLLVPVRVRPIDNGFELVYGHRRVEAMRRLGWEETEAIVETVDDLTSLFQQLIENELREDIPYRERAEGYEAALAAAQCNVPELSRRTGIPKTRIYEALHWLEEYRGGTAVIVNENEAIGPKDTGVVRTLEIRRALGDDTEAKKAVAQKVANERLGRFQAREIAEAIASTPDPGVREELLRQPYSSSSWQRQKAAISQPPPSKPFHASDRPLAEQYHAKFMWNLSRIDLSSYSHFTIGYSQRSWEQVAEILIIAKVSVLIDARRNPVSQYKPEFSKANLTKAAQIMGIQYNHIPELGIDASDRVDLAESHDYDTLFTEYGRRVTFDMIADLLGNRIDNERLAFLCVELDPLTCHRHCIARILEAAEYETLDL